MPQATAASALAFYKLLETLDDIPKPDEVLLNRCKHGSERTALPKKIGGLEKMLYGVNKCQDLCSSHLKNFNHHINLMDSRLAEVKKHLGRDVEHDSYRDALGVVNNTRKCCTTQKERYSDALMGLLFTKEDIKDAIATLKEEVVSTDHEWVWVPDEYCYINLKDWVDVEAEVGV